ncbi:MAG TPA: DHA2 family efflux MFS transporter permease subunit [Actinocrinis sp.]|nr:DHA2 family efflux MFS transporter permease subunit [Actinocrinis sp.]
MPTTTATVTGTELDLELEPGLAAELEATVAPEVTDTPAPADMTDPAAPTRDADTTGTTRAAAAPAAEAVAAPPAKPAPPATSATPAGPPPGAAPPSGMPGPNVAKSIAAIGGAFLALLDTTVVNVSLNATTARFGSIGSVQWIVTSYLLALAAVMPATGWLATRFNVKKVFVAALTLFALGSAACAFSQTLLELIIARSVSGAAAGVITPVSTVLLTRGVPRERLGKVQSLSGSVQLISPLLGPTIGGLLVQAWSWPAVYAVNIPLCALLLGYTLWKVPSESTKGMPVKPLDLVGLISAAACTVSTVLAIRGFTSYGLRPTISTLVPLAVALPAGFVFVVHSLRFRFPLLDLRLFSIRVYRTAVINIFCLGFVLYSPMVLVPLYFESGRGVGSNETGLLLSTAGVGVVLSGLLSRRLMRQFGGGWTLLAGIVLTIAATIPMTELSSTTSFTLVCASLVVRGFGTGLTIVPAMTRAFESIPPMSIPDASSQLNLTQRIGGALATAVVTVILTRQATALHGLTPPAFAHSFTWVLGAYIITLVPALALVFADRSEARRRS